MCKHKLEYCSGCDRVYCSKCEKEWKRVDASYPDGTTPFPVIWTGTPLAPGWDDRTTAFPRDFPIVGAYPSDSLN